MMTNKNAQPAGVAPYYNAAEAGTVVKHFAETQKRVARAALRWGLPSLDAANVPARYPGCVYVVQARSFHGKSLFASHILREDVKQLHKRSRDDSGLVDVSLNVKLEETVEQVTVQYWNSPDVKFRDIVSGRSNTEGINRAAVAHGADPFVLVGFAAGRDAVLPPNILTKTRVSVEDLYDINRRLMENNGMRVVAVTIDMINRMHDVKGGRALYERISNISLDILDFASATALPVVVFAQSVLKGNIHAAAGFPEMDDIAGSSDICRDAEAVFSLWKPNRDRGVTAKREGVEGSMITIDGREIQCESWMLGLKVLKYRNSEPDVSTGIGIADRELLLRISAGGILTETEMETVKL
jgi:replicative DNA helicase